MYLDNSNEAICRVYFLFWNATEQLLFDLESIPIYSIWLSLSLSLSFCWEPCGTHLKCIWQMGKWGVVIIFETDCIPDGSDPVTSLSGGFGGLKALFGIPYFGGESVSRGAHRLWVCWCVCIGSGPMWNILSLYIGSPQVLKRLSSCFFSQYLPISLSLPLLCV